MQSSFDAESTACFDQHRWAKRLWTHVHAVYIANNDSIRIVVMEYHVHKNHFAHYILGVQSAFVAPRVVLKICTASTASFWATEWGDVMFQVRFEEDPDLDGKFIVRGDPDPVRAFLYPNHRKTQCEATDLPNVFSYSDNSLWMEFPGRIKAATFEHIVGQCLAMTSLLLET